MSPAPSAIPPASASAPGKLVLLGDYAVLEGAHALVAAVDRRVRGAPDPSAPGSSVVDAVLARARAAGYPALAGVALDSRRLREPNGDKLGLGSSAAVAVVTAGLAAPGAAADACFAIALEGHRDAAGGVGSGVDVAASFYGGVIATGLQPAPVSPLPARLPGLELAVLYANASASTAGLVSAARRAPSWAAWVDVLGPLADEGIEAWRSGQVEAFASVVGRYGRAMAGLGRDAGVPIVTETIAEIMRLAEEAGGAAKPSGAGGGDVVLVVSRDPSLGERIAAGTGARRVELDVDPVGLRFEP